MITTDNYEGYLMRYADGELPEKERAEVESFLTAHPELREELAEISDPALRVTAPLVTMPNKERLMHPVRPSAKIWLRIAAAVAFILFAAGVVRSLMPHPSSPTLVAKKTHTNTTISDTLPPDSLYIKPILREPVLLAEKTENGERRTENGERRTENGEREYRHRRAQVEKMDKANTLFIYDNTNTIVLMPSKSDYPTMPELPGNNNNVRLIAGRVIVVECDNLVENVPQKDIVTPSGTRSGMVVESNHLVAEERGNFLDNLLNTISNRFKQNNINNDVICEL